MPEPHRPATPALDPPMVPFALAGTVLWAIAGLVLLVAGAPVEWLWTCLAGVLLGIPGLAIMMRHDRRRGHRRARPPAQP